MKHLVGKVQTKKVEFAGDKVEIKKLSIREVMSLQDVIKKAKKDADQMGALYDILRMAVIGAEDMTEDDFSTFPPADLNKLSEEILAYSGLAPAGPSEGN